MSVEGGYRMVTNAKDLPGFASVLYIHGEGAQKSIMYLKSQIRVIVMIPFRELLRHYGQKCSMVQVHSRWVINATYIRHLQLNVPLHIGMVHLDDNTTVPISGRGCVEILDFLNQQRASRDFL
jgi:hypothetical protein